MRYLVRRFSTSCCCFLLCENMQPLCLVGVLTGVTVVLQRIQELTAEGESLDKELHELNVLIQNLQVT